MEQLSIEGMGVSTGLLAITLWRPWDQAILRAGKRIENRPWKRPSIAGRLIAIHAGERYDKAGRSWMMRNGLYTPPKDLRSPKGIVGVMRVRRFITSSDDPWFVGPFGWELYDVKEIDPVPCKGAQGLWTVPPDVAERVLEQLV